MPFKYQKLWDMLEYRDMTRSELRAKIKVSQSTITNMGKNENVSLDVIDKICALFDCTPDDIMEYYKPFDINTPFVVKAGDFFNVIEGDIYNINAELVPVVVIQSDNLNQIIPTIIVSPLKEVDNIDDVEDDSTILIEADKYYLKKNYIIDINTLYSIDRKKFRDRIGNIFQLDSHRLFSALARLLGCFQNPNEQP